MSIYVPAIQAQYRTSVRVNIADAVEGFLEFSDRFKRGKEDHGVYLTDPGALFVNGADLSGEDKFHFSLTRAGGLFVQKRRQVAPELK